MTRRTSDAASATRGRRKLLALNFFPTFVPPRSGGEQRAFHLLDALAADFDVTSLTPTHPGTREDTVRHGPHFVERRFAKTHVYGEWHTAFRKDDLPIVGADLATALSLPYHPAFMRALRREWAGAEIVVLQHPAMVTAICDLDRTGKRIVYLSHNCEFELAFQSLTTARGGDLLALILQLEARLCAMADDIAVVLASDALKMQALYGVPAERFVFVPNGSASRFAPDEPLDATEPDLAVFVGSNWKPNVEAARFVVERLAPQCPAIRFSIVGGVCRALGGSQVPPNVRLEYELDDCDLAERLRVAHVALNPMRSGGGSNVKVADYLAHGLRVLTTPTGIRGFPADLANVEICEDAGFAARLAHLVEAGAPSGTERRAWRDAAAQHWDWSQIGRTLAARLRRPRPAGGARVRRHVVLNEFPVAASDSGGEARIAGLFSAAADDERFVVLSFGRGGFALNVLSERVVCLEIPLSVAQGTRLADANRGVYASVNDLVLPTSVADNSIFLAVAAHVTATAETVIFSHPFMLPVYEHLVLKRPILHDSHNVEGSLKEAALETHPRRDALLQEIRRQEARVAQGAILVAACSDADVRHFERLGAQRVVLAQNGVFVGAAERPPLAAVDAPHEAPLFLDRGLYLVEEFDACPDEAFIDLACRAVLKRPATRFDEHAVDASAADWRARLLVRLMRCPENERRVLVLGALRRAGEREVTAVFMGSGHRPNLTAAQMVAQVIAPARPDMNFLILGQVGASMRRDGLPANVFVSGFVDAALKSRALWRADIGLNPMVGGGGSNLKVPDYLAHGLPVLSSTFGGRGFEIGEAEGLFLADIPDFPARLGAIEARFAARPFDAAAALAKLRSRYDWTRISKRFLGAARAAVAADAAPEILVVVEDATILRAGPFSPALRLIEDLARTRPSEAIFQADPLTPGETAELGRLTPPGLRRYTLATREREFFLSNASRLVHDSLLGGILDVVHTSCGETAILDALEGCDVACPVILSGAGNPVEAAHPWRFVGDELLVALPQETLSVVLSGKAHRPIEITMEGTGGQRLGRFDVAGAFEVRCFVEAPLVWIRTRSSDPAQDIGSAVRMQINRLAAEVGSVERAADLWSSSPAILHALGLGSDRRRLAYGQALPVLSAEAADLVRARCASVPTILALGSAAFAAAVGAAAHGVRPDCRVAAFDGTALRTAPARAATAHRQPLREAELGLIHNDKERGFLADPHLPGDAVLILAEAMNGEILRFAAALKRALASAGARLDVAVLTTCRPGAADRPEPVRRALDAVRHLRPRSDREMIAILGRASFVVVRGDALRFGRAPDFLAALRVPAAVWRTGAAMAADPFAGLDTISTIPEVLARIWARRGTAGEERSHSAAGSDPATPAAGGLAVAS